MSQTNAESKTKMAFVWRPFLWFWNLSLLKKVLLLLILSGVGYWFWTSQNKSLAIQITNVKKGDLIESISASGEVDAKERADLVFQTAGKLSWVGVSEGDTVHRGQVIASLDKTQLQATLKKYLNAYEKELSKFKDTHDSADDVVLTDAVSRIKNRAAIDLQGTVIDVELQNETIRLATLTTPIAGIVTTAEPKFGGVNVGPTTASYQIVNPQTVYFKSEVNEIDVTKIRSGTTVEIELDAYPGQLFKEHILDISFASKTTSTGGTAYTVSITLPENDDFKFRLGMNGDAEFVLSSKENVLLVPQTSIVEDNDNTYIWVIDNKNRAHRKEVKTGISSIDEIEIIEGITEGERIATRPPKELQENTKVSSGAN